MSKISISTTPAGWFCWALVLGLITQAGGSTALAQSTEELSLSPRFRPDPLSLAGTAGGSEDATLYVDEANSACVGWISPQPNHLLRLESDFDYLEVQVQSLADTTLVIRGRDRTYCDDDTYGLNPAIGGAFRAGLYAIHVGTFNESNEPAYTISFSQQRTSLEESQRLGPSGLQIGSLAPSFGSVTLARGFMPDPQRLTGTSGGVVDAFVLDSMAVGPCRGWVSRAPDHVLILTTPLEFMRMAVRSSGDTTLVVHGPSGWRCEDDVQGLNPVIEGQWAAGAYRIWVGSFLAGEAWPYTLTFSEQREEAESEIRDGFGLDLDCETPNFSAAVLRPGFSPDPLVLSGTSGGSVNVAALGTSYTGPCVGWVSVYPDHLVELEEPFEYLSFGVQGSGDTTMVILGPGGWLCNDDDSGLNPRIEGSWMPGPHRIWIGSYAGGQMHSYLLEISTEAPATEAPATEAPATEAPATEAPATEAPATEAPATEAPATEAPATEAPATEDSALDE